MLVAARLGFAQRLQHAWSRRGPLARVLWPVSLVYGGLVALRRWCYRVGILPIADVSALVVVVGNVVVGGAGKTPVVIELARHLRKRGHRVGIISRGYGRIGDACFEVEAAMVATDCGDEPLLLKRALSVPVFVAQRRVVAARALLDRYPSTDVVLSDDGLQHLGMARDIEICLFDERGLGNGWLLPAGPMREPWPRPVDLVLSSAASPASGQHRMSRSLSDLALRSDGTRVHLADLRDRRLVALAAIAQPEPFFAMLRAKDLVLEQAIALPDHDDLHGWLAPADPSIQLIFTEKDAVKLWRRDPRGLAVPLCVDLGSAFLREFDALVDARLSSSRRARTDGMNG
jgi:tetraacyldisaccharide 4'-kinase